MAKASMKEGEWELRDGKFYRRDVVSISGGEQQRHTVKVYQMWSRIPSVFLTV